MKQRWHILWFTYFVTYFARWSIHISLKLYSMTYIVYQSVHFFVISNLDFLIFGASPTMNGVSLCYVSMGCCGT